MQAYSNWSAGPPFFHLSRRPLRQRNRLLWQVRERGSQEEELNSWDELLVRDGTEILVRRREVVAKLQTKLAGLAEELLGSVANAKWPVSAIVNPA